MQFAKRGQQPRRRALHRQRGGRRRCARAGVYLLSDGRIAIANRTGWFTDRSESARAGQEGQSAWVIDLKREPRNADGVIVLRENNLVRWFFREHRRAALPLIRYEGPLVGVNVAAGDRIHMSPDHHSFTLLLGGETHRITLTQE